MNLRNFAIWGVILLGLVTVYAAISQNGGRLVKAFRQPELP